MTGGPAFITDWGSTAAERAEHLACDELITRPDLELHRAVDVSADAATVFRWLCQLRAAPYSYDLIDNGGRRSPQQLTPGLEQLEPGQRFMRIFHLVSFEQERAMTLLSEGRLFGRVACTYLLRAAGRGRSRLLVRVLVAYPRGRSPGWLRTAVLAPGDLVMMRRQLLNLRRLAEASARAEPPGLQVS